MNVALVGAHGVGKTTLALNLYRFFSSTVHTSLSTGIPRSIINRGMSLGKSATVDSYREYIRLQLSRLRKSHEYDLFISDRSLIDPYAYARVNFASGYSLIEQSDIDLLQYVWELESRCYDLYLYLPIQFNMEVDGVRPLGEKYRSDIDQELRDLLVSSGLNYVEITGSESDMAAKAIQHISSKEWLNA